MIPRWAAHLPPLLTLVAFVMLVSVACGGGDSITGGPPKASTTVTTNLPTADMLATALSFTQACYKGDLDSVKSMSDPIAQWVVFPIPTPVPGTAVSGVKDNAPAVVATVQGRLQIVGTRAGLCDILEPCLSPVLDTDTRSADLYLKCIKYEVANTRADMPYPEQSCGPATPADLTNNLGRFCRIQMRLAIRPAGSNAGYTDASLCVGVREFTALRKILVVSIATLPRTTFGCGG